MKSRHAELYQFSSTVLFRWWFLKVSNSDHRFINPEAWWNPCSWVFISTVTTHCTSGRRQDARTWEEKRTPHATHTHPHPLAFPFKRLGWHFVIWSKFGVIEFYSSSSPPVWNSQLQNKVLNCQLRAFYFGSKPNSTYVFYSKCALHWKVQDLHICDFALTLSCLEPFSNCS